MDGVGDDQMNAHQHFDDEIEVQLNRHTRRYIEVWLAHTEPLVQQGLAEAAQTIVTGHLDICDYFYPPDMPPSRISHPDEQNEQVPKWTRRLLFCH
jgi:hypothetical protein